MWHCNEEDVTIPIDLETVTEARLVAQALAGAQPAFEQIVRRYERPVITLIRRMTGNPALAEDLAQETFVKAFRNLAAFDTTRRFSSWIFRIAHHTAIDALRRSGGREVSLQSLPAGATRDVVLTAASEPDPVETQSLGAALDAAIRELRPEYRAAISLRYDEGLPFDEIGQVMGIPEATARTYVHRARKELARRLEDAGWAPGR